MLPVYINIAFPTDDRGRGVFSKRAWREAVGDGMDYLADYWFRVLLRKHFTVAGGKEYAYVPRRKGYMIAKNKRWHHQNPLVWSGTLFRAVTSVFDRKRTGMTVKIWLHPPKGAYLQTKNGIDMVAEMTAFSEADVHDLEDRLADFVARRMNGEPPPERTYKTVMVKGGDPGGPEGPIPQEPGTYRRHAG
jgi:hypothetical protein